MYSIQCKHTLQCDKYIICCIKKNSQYDNNIVKASYEMVCSYGLELIDPVAFLQKVTLFIECADESLEIHNLRKKYDKYDKSIL